MAVSIPQPSIITFTEMTNSISEIHQAHAQMLKTGLFHNPFAASRLISFSTISTSISNPQTLTYAYSVFNRIPNPNNYLWNTIIRSFANSSFPEQSLLVFHQMLHSSISPDKFTYPFVLKACSSLSSIDEGQQIHAQILKTGFGSDVYVQNSLIHVYARVGNTDKARLLLDKMLQSDVISWNAILSAFTERGLMEKARKLFEEMPEKNVESWNFMISGYVGLGLVEEARRLFDEMPLRDVVSWNAMITGYARSSQFGQVLKLFEDMQIAKVKPDNYTLVNVLSACAQVGALNQGEWVHAYIDKNNNKIHGFLATALVDMYSKCGCIEKAVRVFSDTKKKDISTWNSIIAGLSIHGYGKDALRMFSEMMNDGFKPNEITFISVFSACSRSGLLDEGRRVLDLMVHVHGIKPSVEHYGCIVDLLGRAGSLKEAEELVEMMPLKEEALGVWQSLLSACRIHSNVELAERVAEKILKLNPKDSYSYVQLSNIYAAKERWNDVREVRRKMRIQKVRKEPGSSMIEIDGIVHEFLAGDGLHS
ncbi:Pentatricopeptide repeat [Macleaya cordata]|uniref:Pentatricopeptide repeat n=1 Tax=Macleaya cordata TaxID=56857 RepID=A0A200QPN9_MACCD|nr:Pentatricopeptide repeat [Macleaya cordata]